MGKLAYNVIMKNTQYKIDTKTGLLLNNKYSPSSFNDERPPETEIDLVVIHNISLPPGQFGTNDVEQFFLGKLDIDKHPYFKQIHGMCVSAHLFITRFGDIIQFVPFTRRAWHAGESSFMSRPRCNDYSVGIELEGADDIPYEGVQYETLAGVLRALMLAYPAITCDRIVGHVDVAPNRKTDPGKAFDWSYLKGMLL